MSDKDGNVNVGGKGDSNVNSAGDTDGNTGANMGCNTGVDLVSECRVYRTIWLIIRVLM